MLRPPQFAAEVSQLKIRVDRSGRASRSFIQKTFDGEGESRKYRCARGQVGDTQSADTARIDNNVRLAIAGHWRNSRTKNDQERSWRKQLFTRVETWSPTGSISDNHLRHPKFAALPEANRRDGLGHFDKGERDGCGCRSDAERLLLKIFGSATPVSLRSRVEGGGNSAAA